MWERPDDVFTGLDCKNAFGTVTRDAAMAEAAELCPELAPLLSALRCGAQPIFWLEQPGSKHTAHEVMDGCVQGGCKAQPAFCLALHRTLKALARSDVAEARRWRLWAYVDDLILQCSQADWGC